jgi:hypothetical protein
MGKQKQFGPNSVDLLRNNIYRFELSKKYFFFTKTLYSIVSVSLRRWVFETDQAICFLFISCLCIEILLYT